MSEIAMIDSPAQTGRQAGRAAGERYLMHAKQGTMKDVRALLPEKVALAKCWAEVLLSSDDESERNSAEYNLAMYAELERYFVKANEKQ